MEKSKKKKIVLLFPKKYFSFSLCVEIGKICRLVEKQGSLFIIGLIFSTTKPVIMLRNSFF